MRQAATGRTITRIWRELSTAIPRLANRLRIAFKDRTERKLRAAGPTVQERQDQLVWFYERYEDLVEVLCDSAQFGATPALEEKYSRLRAWMLEHYKNVKPYAIAYLRFSPEDAEMSLRAGTSGSDAFEALIAAKDLKEFLALDDGNMISRITRTREALNLYGEHLRQLAAKTQ